jgi:2-polyprenyl-3-methyl-5-hydroxy-6-metoxy-1,4-benzoquinol methylase
MTQTRPNLSRREIVGEEMDDPALPEYEHRLALNGLRRINACSFTARTLGRQLERVLGADPGRPVRVLDVACGDGDNAIKLGQFARRRGLLWRIDGCDLSERSVGLARARATEQQLDASFFRADALRDFTVEGYDAVVNSLFLHHLEDGEIIRFLSKLTAVKHVVISDLVRTRRAYAMTWVGVRLLSRSRVVHTDGPLSVRAALKPAETRSLADRAGLAGARVTRCWPMRQLLTWSRLE